MRTQKEIFPSLQKVVRKREDESRERVGVSQTKKQDRTFQAEKVCSIWFLEKHKSFFPEREEEVTKREGSPGSYTTGFGHVGDVKGDKVWWPLCLQ